MLAGRAHRSHDDVTRAGLGFRKQALTLPEVAEGRRVALFVGQGGEPDTQPLVDALHSRGVAVLLPILLGDFDLDWGLYVPGMRAPGRLGLLEATTDPLGRSAVTAVTAVICPGVAVDLSGNRIGRGGGSYDRALARCGLSVLRCQLAYDDEVLDSVPTLPHDEPIDVIITPTATVRTGRGRPPRRHTGASN